MSWPTLRRNTEENPLLALNLRDHMMTHWGEASCLHWMWETMWRHAQEKPFACTRCDKAWADPHWGKSFTWVSWGSISPLLLGLANAYSFPNIQILSRNLWRWNNKNNPRWLDAEQFLLGWHTQWTGQVKMNTLRSYETIDLVDNYPKYWSQERCTMLLQEPASIFFCKVIC